MNDLELFHAFVGLEVPNTKHCVLTPTIRDVIGNGEAVDSPNVTSQSSDGLTRLRTRN